MRAFATVHPQFWNGTTGKQFRKAGAEVQVIALYLITGPHAHMSGMYYLPKQTIAYETGQTMKSVNRVLKTLSALQFAFYDEDAEYIWVKEMLAWQVRDIKPTDNRVTGIVKWCNSLPSLSFLPAFHERYSTYLPNLKPLQRPLEAPSEGVQEGLPSPSTPVPVPSPVLDLEERGVGKETTKQPEPKKKFGEHGNILLTETEHSQLVSKFGLDGAENRIRGADLYIGSTGKSYKSHYLTILKWEHRNGTHRQSSNGTQGETGSERTSRGDLRYHPRQ